MFQDIVKNKDMLEGAYRKLKSYYYYNKNFIVMREKISEFENDAVAMDNTFTTLALNLSKLRAKASKSYFNDLCLKINFYAIPKKFEALNIEKENKPVSNTLSRDKKMKTVNFFIDMPIELHIIDTLWTLFISKISADNDLITTNAYGNTILESIVSDYSNEEGIAFQSNRLFNLYFRQYSEWRNKAFEVLENNHKKGKNSVLISLDLQGYFYSVLFSFEKLKEQCQDKKMLIQIYTLTTIIKNVYTKYKEVITPYRKDLALHSLSQFPLPIGLFSSMVLSNVYLSDFDKKVKTLKNISYYGRYVDDFLFVCEENVSPDMRNEDIMLETLVEQKLFSIEKNNYVVSDMPHLKIQKDKVKIIYLDHTESRALIDIYNKTIRVLPSQTDLILDFDLKISSFDENAYSIEHFTKENKLRDIGHVSIDAYKVSRFFSTLIMKYSHINSFDFKSKEVQDGILDNIQQIENFFTGSQCVEYYSNWMNYMYFLVITQRWKELKEFYLKAKHYDELLLLLFYDNHKKNQTNGKNNYVKEEIVKKFVRVNHLNYGENPPFEIGYQDEETLRFPNNETFQYTLRNIHVPTIGEYRPKEVKAAVANIKLEFDAIKSAKNSEHNRWKNITLTYKTVLQDIFRETYKYNKKCSLGCAKILVLPELSVPIYWIDDIIRFAKRTQTAIVAGLQYIYDDRGRAYNYILTVLPFECGKQRYKNSFVYIREKNDYSPIEKVELAKTHHHCVDANIADYQVFTWKGVDLAAFVCYEFTDIFARALLKGRCDIIAVPVFNQDTTYFSNIIDTAVRDLHAFIIQSNTSIFGDSRVTGPYNRDSKDILKIKGGENDNIIVGTIDFAKYAEYQSKYYENLSSRIHVTKSQSKNNCTEKQRSKPDIKPLSARFHNHRTKYY